jgi:hypothetical protein
MKKTIFLAFAAALVSALVTKEVVAIIKKPKVIDPDKIRS